MAYGLVFPMLMSFPMGDLQNNINGLKIEHYVNPPIFLIFVALGC
jgi:hypothetical protein